MLPAMPRMEEQGGYGDLYAVLGDFGGGGAACNCPHRYSRYENQQYAKHICRIYDLPYAHRMAANDCCGV